MKYSENKNLNYAQIGKEILQFWKDERIFEASVETKASNPTFTFYEGPPSANGTPGIHHVMARAVKDIFCRYKTLKGFQVKRKGGWDTHGLPVELQVEKLLGITKEDIGKKISVEEYNAKCREAVMKYKGQWDELTELMGYWVDLDDPYITFDRNYMETLWWLLKQFHDKGLLYKGYTIQPYSPAAGSGLSSHELNQPGTYKMVKDTTVTAQFKVEKNEKSAFLYDKTDTDIYILAWTTTPWTLAANNGLAVGANISYNLIKTVNPYTFKPVTLVLAKDRVSAYFNPKGAEMATDDFKEGDKVIPYKIIAECKGKDLKGIDYEQLLPYVKVGKPAFTVVIGDFVTTEDGTGIVHISKTFGADDYRVSVQNDLPGIFVKDEEGNDAPIVDKQGRYVEQMGEFAGKFVKNEYYGEGAPDKTLDIEIAIKLKEENKAFKVEKYEHTYPHCWRTDKPVLYYPMESWFIKTTAFKDRLVELNKTINWKPASTGSGRFGNWLENLVDWNLSRSRYWGTPLPIWTTEDGKEEKCIGSLDELKKEVAKAVKAGLMDSELADDFDLHRPYVDDIVLVSDSGEVMRREPDLIDVWFDSGAMPYAQLHYPFSNKEEFEKNYPADLIAEGVDQTRGWFFTLHAIATMQFDSVAFKNVIANGLVLDKHGNKMSKRLGNAVDPFETINTYGPDATRWYMISNANPWDNLKFDINGIVEVQRRFFGTLQNTYSFFALYANLDAYDYTKHKVDHSVLSESDQWIISRLNSLVKNVDRSYEEYEPTRAARLIQDFVIDDLSNWYVRLNRKRFWKGELNDDKIAAYQTLHSCLKVISILISPIAPFYSDKLFKDLQPAESASDKKLSVHLVDFPNSDQSMIKEELEYKMRLSQQISSLVHSLRKQHKIKVRQPLSKIMLPVLDARTEDSVKAVEDIIKSEVNIKSIEFVDGQAGVIVKKAKPNFRKLGAQYGPKMKEISGAIAQLSQDQIGEFEKNGSLTVPLNGESIDLKDDDLLIQSEDMPGWSVASEGGLTVALDITITDDLLKEGIAREMVNKVQNLRKDKGLDVQDKINIRIKTDQDLIEKSLTDHSEYICSETQALSLSFVEALEGIDVAVENYNVVVDIDVAK